MTYEWAPVDEKPQEDGKYLVTIVSRDLEKKVVTSNFKNGRWMNPYVIAWMPIQNIEPYQGDSQIEEKIKKTHINKAAIMKRRERAFNLRRFGLSYKKIAEEMGVSLSVATTDVQYYLRRKGENVKCFSCVNAMPNTKLFSLGGGEWCSTDWICKLIKADVSCGCGCPEYLCAEERVCCKDCTHSKVVVGRRGAEVRCEIHNRTEAENTCNDAKRKDNG